MKIILDSPLKYDAYDIMRRISNERIYEHFYGENIKPKIAYKCPFHNDSTPSMYFHKTGDIIAYKCFGCEAKGNAIKFVQDLNNLSYRESIELIVNTFEGKGVSKNNNIISKEFTEVKLSTKIISIPRKFNSFDLIYWNSFGISIETLKKYGVFACETAYILSGDKTTVIFNSIENPLYCYKFNEEHYKLYKPLNPTKKGKFYYNGPNDLFQGIEVIPETDDLLIITSSLKDVMVLNEIGYNAIAPQSENVIVAENVMCDLKKRYKRIVLLYDSDKAGYEFADKINKIYGLEAIFIPEMYGVKDISDFSKKYNLDDTRNLIDILING